MSTLRVFATGAAPAGLLAKARALMSAAFGDDFGETDWEHALGGWHVVLLQDDEVLAHAALVRRGLEAAGRLVDCEYVEAVATSPSAQGRGHGSAVMAEVAELLRRRHDLGVLSTGRHAFYERLGWERWQGPTYVRDGTALTRTPDEDDGIMVLRFGATRALPLNAPMVCEARDGDDW
ncbi:GNAT family N-acetyltransferase [Egicoccus sp. AB-alg2]|uniref:GNAT family N-acetyltransferase n=1 Tax=Egicoccus sp. AB-alg2 TaxID=3242693 RepID=UPI00359E76C4